MQVLVVMLDAFDWTKLAQSGGVVGMFIILTWAILTQKLVPGWVFTAMERDRDYYRDIAHKGVELADRQIAIAETLADRAGLLETREQLLSRRENEDRARELEDEAYDRRARRTTGQRQSSERASREAEDFARHSGPARQTDFPRE